MTRPATPPKGAVLGLWDGHDASVALIADGRLVFALSEERPSRRKRHSGFPTLALARALEWAAEHRVRVTDVAVAGECGRAPLRLLEPWYAGADPHRDPLDAAGTAVRAWENGIARLPLARVVEREAGLLALRARLRRVLPEGFRLHTVPHHDAHAFSALLAASDATARILTWDAYGEGCAATLRAADAPDRPIDVLPVGAALAFLYGVVTLALGFGEDDEGKVMGLAARGTPARLRDRFDALFVPDPARPLLLRPLTRDGVRRLVADAAREDVAAALQEAVERRVLGWLAPRFAREGAPRRLLLAGGLFANIRVNQALAVAPGIAGVSVFPNMGDGGLSAGAAHAVWNRVHHAPAAPPGDAFLGVAFGPDEVLRAVRDSGLPFRRVPDPARAAAERLRRGEVVCRFAGRDEFGPRALGNRSILFDAATPGLPHRVNAALRRDGFMPFGPSVVGEASEGAWTPLPGTDLGTMTVAVDATPAFATVCPAAVHVDGTSRPQVVEPRTAPGLHAILAHVHRDGGPPAVINTSFNLHGEPIVHTPTNALATFRQAGFEALYLGDLEVTPR